MTVISADKAKEFQLYDILYQIHSQNDKLKYFERKYVCNYSAFQKEINVSKEENFEKWNDFMEWKAVVKYLDQLQKAKKDLESGHFTISK